MWWNPSLALDLDYMALLPTLNLIALDKYSLTADSLKKLMSSAVEHENLQACIGTLQLWFKKQKASERGQEFRVNHVINVDTLFYLLSQPGITKQMQYLLQWLARLIFQKCFSSLSRSQLDKFESGFKKLINAFESTVNETNRDNMDESVKISTQLLKLFQDVAERNASEADHADYQKRLSESVKYIYLNRKQIYFANVLYDIWFSLIHHLHKQEDFVMPSQLINFIRKQLFFLSIKKILSFSLQHMAFIMKKIIPLKKIIPSTQYNEFMLLIESIVETEQINPLNLRKKISHFPYHMRHNHYFTLLQKLFGMYKKPEELKKQLTYWKEAIRTHLEESERSMKEKVSQDDINEAIFYLQLRNKGNYLIGPSKQVNQFPDLNHKVIKHTIRHHMVKYSLDSSYLAFLIVSQPIQIVYQAYQEFNIFEKGIFFYQLSSLSTINFKHYDKQISSQIVQKACQKFYQSLNNLELFKIIQHFLFDLQLGNFYQVQKNQTVHYQNTVNKALYMTLIDLLYKKISHHIVHFKEIKESRFLNVLTRMKNYYSILITSLFFSEEPINICPTCKKQVYFEFCPVCYEVSLTVKLKSPRQSTYFEKNTYSYRSMISQIKQKAILALRQVLQDKHTNNREAEWLFMLQPVLYQLARLRIK